MIGSHDFRLGKGLISHSPSTSAYAPYNVGQIGLCSVALLFYNVITLSFGTGTRLTMFLSNSFGFHLHLAGISQMLFEMEHDESSSVVEMLVHHVRVFKFHHKCPKSGNAIVNPKHVLTFPAFSQ